MPFEWRWSKGKTIQETVNHFLRSLNVCKNIRPASFYVTWIYVADTKGKFVEYSLQYIYINLLYFPYQWILTLRHYADTPLFWYQLAYYRKYLFYRQRVLPSLHCVNVGLLGLTAFILEFLCAIGFDSICGRSYHLVIWTPTSGAPYANMD